jgi:hypothetical protein
MTLCLLSVPGHSPVKTTEEHNPKPSFSGLQEQLPPASLTYTGTVPDYWSSHTCIVLHQSFSLYRRQEPTEHTQCPHSLHLSTEIWSVLQNLAQISPLAWDPSKHLPCLGLAGLYCRCAHPMHTYVSIHPSYPPRSELLKVEAVSLCSMQVINEWLHKIWRPCPLENYSLCIVSYSQKPIYVCNVLFYMYYVYFTIKIRLKSNIIRRIILNEKCLNLYFFLFLRQGLAM